jgi:hypothetical protein
LQDFASDDDVMINASQAFFFLLSYPMSDPKKLHRANQSRFLAAGAGAAIEVALAVPACEMSELLEVLKALLATPAVEGVWSWWHTAPWHDQNAYAYICEVRGRREGCTWPCIYVGVIDIHVHGLMRMPLKLIMVHVNSIDSIPHVYA